MDRLTGTLDVLDMGNRSITATINMVGKLVNGLRTLDGNVDITFDSDGLCAGSFVAPALVSPIKWTQVLFVFTEHLKMTKDPTFTDNMLYILLESPR